MTSRDACLSCTSWETRIAHLDEHALEVCALLLLKELDPLSEYVDSAIKRCKELSDFLLLRQRGNPNGFLEEVGDDYFMHHRRPLRAPGEDPLHEELVVYRFLPESEIIPTPWERPEHHEDMGNDAIPQVVLDKSAVREITASISFESNISDPHHVVCPHVIVGGVGGFTGRISHASHGDDIPG